jgi:hypothetical protein
VFLVSKPELETGNLKLLLRIAIPAPRREAQEELNTFKKTVVGRRSLAKSQGPCHSDL